MEQEKTTEKKPHIRSVGTDYRKLVDDKKVTEAKCEKCDYGWTTKSDMVFVSCPSCGNKVKIREIKKNE